MLHNFVKKRYLGLILVVPHKVVAVGCCESTHLLIYLCIDLASWLSISLSNSVSINQSYLPYLSLCLCVSLETSSQLPKMCFAPQRRALQEASRQVTLCLQVDWSLEHLSQELFKESCLFLWSCWSKLSFCSTTKRMKRRPSESILPSCIDRRIQACTPALSRSASSLDMAHQRGKELASRSGKASDGFRGGFEIWASKKTFKNRVVILGAQGV